MLLLFLTHLTPADIGPASNPYNILEPKSDISTAPTSSITYVSPSGISTVPNSNVVGNIGVSPILRPP
jgi:hypothetical protein